MSWLARGLDVRPGEVRPLALSFFGAFSVMAFLVLARSLRDALYLTRFDATKLPYVIAATALLGLPAAVAFTGRLAREHPAGVFRSLVLVLAAGLLVLWPLVDTSNVAVVVFYLWTAVGTLLLTSGFWILTSEIFALREAKRLFGIISGGGTLGAMTMGLSVHWLTSRAGTGGTIPVLVVWLGVVLGLQMLTDGSAPTVTPADLEGQDAETSFRGGLELVAASPHLRTIALIVLCATLASTLLDYQFKAMVSGNVADSTDLAGFFGTFYGWTGVIAFLVQMLAAAGVLAVSGVAVSLSVLPAWLLLGSAGLLAAPSFVLVVAVRGGDASLRKSLHRFVLEYLYVPLPAKLRRRTKTFIDSVIDSVAEGLGAVVVFAWVTAGGLDARWLSAFVIVIAVAFLMLARRMHGHYMDTLLERLRESDGEIGDRQLVEARFDGKDLLTATYTHFDLQAELARAGLEGSERREPVVDERGQEPAGTATPEEMIASGDAELVARALRENDEWEESSIEALTRLLAQRSFYARAAGALRSIGRPSAEYLIERLLDDETDFVIRRRIPKILAEVDTPEADRALLDALSANRFEVRYRAAIAIVRRRSNGLPEAPGDWKSAIWRAIEKEVSRDRPIWELQKLLDGAEAGDDGFVNERLGVRGELSLEHTFRLLSLVLDAAAVRTAFHGVILDDRNLRSVSLEYLEQVLPAPIRDKLWPFIGDISEHQRRSSLRPMKDVVSELAQTGATLFGGAEGRQALRAALESTKDDDGSA